MGWLGPMTNRQYGAWHEWLRMQWNVPSRDNYYVMQSSRESILPYLEKGSDPPIINDYVLKFGAKDEPATSTKELEETDGPPIMTEASILEAQKQMSIARMGKGAKYEQRWVNKRGEPIPPPPGRE